MEDGIALKLGSTPYQRRERGWRSDVYLGRCRMAALGGV